MVIKYGCPGAHMSVRPPRCIPGDTSVVCPICWDQEIPEEKVEFEPKLSIDKESAEAQLINSDKKEASSIKDSVPVYSECPHYDERTETCRDHMDHERCVCGCDMIVCDFFPEKRERAKKMVDSVDKAVNGTVSKDMDTAAEAAVKASENLAKLTSAILDSGTRREFSTGAVRDIQEGKGRCDLMPLGIIADYIKVEPYEKDWVLWCIEQYQQGGYEGALMHALSHFGEMRDWTAYTMMLEVAKHFEAGAAKYGEWNWQKGIPTHCYIDSAVRHYLKFLRGDKDEAHDRAFIWNILCCIWTCKHKPELNDYPRKEKTDE